MERNWFTRYRRAVTRDLARGPVQPTFAVLGSDIYTTAPPAAPFDPVPPARTPSRPAPVSGAPGPSFLDYLQ